jgi:hypothetical protein
VAWKRWRYSIILEKAVAECFSGLSGTESLKGKTVAWYFSIAFNCFDYMLHK